MGQKGLILIERTEHMVIYRDQDGKVWRYMPAFRAKWPVTIIPDYWKPPDVEQTIQAIDGEALI